MFLKRACKSADALFNAPCGSDMRLFIIVAIMAGLNSGEIVETGEMCTCLTKECHKCSHDSSSAVVSIDCSHQCSGGVHHGDEKPCGAARKCNPCHHDVTTRRDCTCDGWKTQEGALQHIADAYNKADCGVSVSKQVKAPEDMPTIWSKTHSDSSTDDWSLQCHEIEATHADTNGFVIAEIDNVHCGRQWVVLARPDCQKGIHHAATCNGHSTEMALLEAQTTKIYNSVHGSISKIKRDEWLYIAIGCFAVGVVVLVYVLVSTRRKY